MTSDRILTEESSSRTIARIIIAHLPGHVAELMLMALDETPEFSEDLAAEYVSKYPERAEKFFDPKATLDRDLK